MLLRCMVLFCPCRCRCGKLREQFLQSTTGGGIGLMAFQLALPAAGKVQAVAAGVLENCVCGNSR